MSSETLRKGVMSLWRSVKRSKTLDAERYLDSDNENIQEVIQFLDGDAKKLMQLLKKLKKIKKFPSDLTEIDPIFNKSKKSSKNKGVRRKVGSSSKKGKGTREVVDVRLVPPVSMSCPKKVGEKEVTIVINPDGFVGCGIVNPDD